MGDAPAEDGACLTEEAVIGVFPKATQYKLASGTEDVPEWRLVPGATGSVAHEPATIVVDNKPEPRYLNRQERRAKASKQRRKR